MMLDYVQGKIEEIRERRARIASLGGDVQDCGIDWFCEPAETAVDFFCDMAESLRLEQERLEREALEQLAGAA